MPANRDIRVEAVTEAVEAKASDSEAAVIDEHVRRPLIGLTPEQLSEVALYASTIRRLWAVTVSCERLFDGM